MATAEDLFLPEPDPRPVRYTVISVDDHVVEPPHTFEGRLPAALQDRAPRIVETRKRPSGLGVRREALHAGRYERGGRPAARDREARAVPVRPDATRLLRRRRPCARHGHQRRVGVGELPVADHRLLRQRVFRCGRPRARCTRACARGTTGSSRSGTTAIPSASFRSASPISPTPALAADEIRRNAARGFTSVTFPERPHAIGLPSLWDREHWDPIIAACVETDTVISLHVGSSGIHPFPAGAPRSQLGATLFGQLAMSACAEWLWSEYPSRHPVAQDRVERGWHRLGRDAARPPRLHRRSVELRRRLDRAAVRGVAPELLVLHARRSVDDRHASPHRRGEHHGRGRLPAR